MAVLLRSHVDVRADEPALIDEDGVTTWAQLDEGANRWVNGLRAAGLTPGQRVAIMSMNRRECWELFVGCLHAGLIAVPIDWELAEDEARYVFRHSGADALIVDPATCAVAAAAAAELPLSVRLVLGDAGSDGFEAAHRFLAASSADEPADQLAGGPMFYTSGTTGRPKGVMSAGVTTAGGPLDALAGSAQAVCGALGFPAGGTAMIVGPNYHSGQFVLSTLPLLAGQRLVIRREPDPVDILETIDRYGVTNVLLLPADFAALLQLPPEHRSEFDGASLAVVLHGGAPTPPDVKRRMIEWLGSCLVEYYGATEGGLFALASTDDWIRRPGTVGRLVPFIECRVIGEDGAAVPTGVEGRLYFRHRGGAEFYYHDDPERTAAAHLEPGLFTVGDIGRLDADGYLYVTGRESDLIDAPGRKIAPGRIEAVLAGQPAVADVAVFGSAGSGGAGRGEEVRAAVVLHCGHRPSPELAAEIRALAASALDGPEVPARIVFLDALPRSAAGKILRTELRSLSVAEWYPEQEGRRGV